MGQASTVPDDHAVSAAQLAQLSGEAGHNRSSSSMDQLENDAKRHDRPAYRSAFSETDIFLQRSFANGSLPMLKKQLTSEASDCADPATISLPPHLSKAAERNDEAEESSSVTSAVNLQRGRRVIRRRRFEDGDFGVPQRRVSFRARMRYDLVLDRTATMRRSKKPGKLTLITTSYFNQPSMAPNENGVVEKALAPNEIRLEDVSERVELYNKSLSREIMWVTSDGTALEGYVEVRLQLKQPIHVMRVGTFGDRDSQLSGSYPSGSASLHVLRLKNCTRTVLVSSDTTVAELIDQLISDYHVIEDPQTFALFECSTTKGSHRGRQLDDEERPLLLMLIWGALSHRYLQLKEARRIRQASVRESVLREEKEPCPVLAAPVQKCGIDWEAFSLPELENFLEMLAQEEQRQLKELEDRYTKRRHTLQELFRSKAKEETKMLAECVTINGSISTLV